MSEHPHDKLAALHASLLHGKLPRTLHWTDTLELIASIGQVEPISGNECAFVVGARREFFKRPHGPELGVDEVSRLRRMLKAALVESPSTEGVPSERMVVVIDHHAAHVFHLSSGPSEDGATIEPYDPHHFHHHLVHRKEAHYRGDRVPEETSFYEEVGQALTSAQEIVLIGHGTGKSSAVDAFAEYLEKHRPEVFRNVIATEIADLSALTTPDIEALAKTHMTPLA